MSALTALINAYIKQNHNQEITGPVLNGVLLQMAAAAENVPYIGANGDWFIYDTATGLYQDTGQTSRGPVGVTAATASVDALVGTPSVEVALNGETLAFAFHNLKGETGATGPAGGVNSVNGRQGNVTGIEETANKTTELGEGSTDAQYPSAKAVVDYVAAHAGGDAQIEDSVPAPGTLIRIDFYTEDELPTQKDEDNPILAYGTVEVNFDGFVLSKYATIEVQGRSSSVYPKKNWTFAFYNDDQYTDEYEFRLGNMVPHSEYVYKANWIDATHCRNIASNRLWEQMVQSRPGYPKRENEVVFDPSDTDLLHRIDSGALCHVDGFPCVLYINGDFYGIGDFNIGKKRINYDLNKNNQDQVQMASEDHTNFYTYTPADWEIRNPKTPDGNFTNRIAPWFASNALSGAAFKSGFEATHNLQNAVDYLLLIEFLYADDCVDHNFLLTTWDGEVFSFMPYDLDTVFNLYWDGSQYTNGVGSVTNSTNNITASAKEFWDKFLNAFNAEIVARYEDLKARDIFSVNNIYRLCTDLSKRYGKDFFQQEAAKWPTIPSNTLIHTSIPQILDWVKDRIAWMDSYLLPVPLQSLAITGPASVTVSGQYGVTYTPGNTTETGVVWSIQSGNEYATIDQSGVVTALDGAEGDSVTIRATSSHDPSIYADKTITVTGSQVYNLTNYDTDGTSATAIRTNIHPFNLSEFPNGFKVQFAGRVLNAAQYGKVYITCIDESDSPWAGFMVRGNENNAGMIDFSYNTSIQIGQILVINRSVGDSFSGEIVYKPNEKVMTFGSDTLNLLGDVVHSWPLCIGGGPTADGPSTWDSNRFAAVHFDYVRVSAF